MAGGGKNLCCRRIYVLAVRFVRLLVVGRMLTLRYTQRTGRGRDVDQLFDETYLADAPASFDIDFDTDGKISGLF